MDNLSKDQIIEFIKIFADKVNKDKDLLTEYDQKIGDGDHGINLNRGLSSVIETLDDLEEKSISDILKNIGMTLVKTVGGASGPLYGTAFMKAANVVEKKENLEAEDISELLGAMIDGIQLRGKAVEGEKTLLDAIIPAKKAFDESLKEDEDLKTALTKAQEAAENGVEYTKTIKATKGRASYLGDRSIGFQDPGATSMAYLIASLNEALEEETEEEEAFDENSVGIVLVSHSKKIADGTKELVLEMAPNAKVVSAGGLPDGSIGTDLQLITDAIESVLSEEGVLILVDLGSALMTSEMAIDNLNKGDLIEIVDAPFVEGAMFAAIESSIGSDKEKIKAVLQKAKIDPKF